MRKFGLGIAGLSMLLMVSACAPQRPDLTPDVEALKAKIKDLEQYNQQIKAVLSEYQIQLTSIQTEIRSIKSPVTPQQKTPGKEQKGKKVSLRALEHSLK